MRLSPLLGVISKKENDMILGDTIAALSTPYGRGGVALLRISGPEAVEVAERVFSPKNGKPLSLHPVRTAVYGAILQYSPGEAAVSIDDGLAFVFRAPASFTGEDVVELTCHGGILLTETVLTSLIAAGARPAEAGEFTRRAFVNGKIGLSAAEALGDLLEAETSDQLTLAHSGMRGRIEEATRAIYEDLRHVLASVYAKIDYPDEDLTELTDGEIDTKLQEAQGTLRSLAETYRTGHAVMEGIPTVICGLPNVGKSSLYNRLVGHDAAIVTSVKGTTRDVLSETAHCGSVTLRLFDTAGIRDTDDLVESIGIERTREAMGKAELILAVFDGGQVPDEETLSLIRELGTSNAEVIAILNKADQCEAVLLDAYRPYLAHIIPFSAVTGEGSEVLTKTVEALFTSGKLDLRQDAILTNARQHGAVLAAIEAVGAARGALRSMLPPDLYCSDIERAMEILSQLDGRAVSEDIVSEIFSHFCVGK